MTQTTGSKPVELLPDADALTGTELMHVVQNGSSRKVALSELGVGGGSYKYGAFAVSDILAGEILMDHQVAVGHVLRADFVDVVVQAGSPPVADWAMDVQHGNVSIGTITIHPDGTVTKTTGGVDVLVGSNDFITAIAPAVADGAIGRVRFTFRGN